MNDEKELRKHLMRIESELTRVRKWLMILSTLVFLGLAPFMIFSIIAILGGTSSTFSPELLFPVVIVGVAMLVLAFKGSPEP